jgi:hypothetical protein
MDNDLARQQAEGLRALADLIETNPELARPLRFGVDSIGAHIVEDEAPEIFAIFARAAKAQGLPVTKTYSEKFAIVRARLGGVEVYLQADREQVCERVVTGTETVTKRVKDPTLLAEVPEVEVIETVETVEWVCKPILASTVDGAR